MKTGGLVLETLDLFVGSYIKVVLNGFCKGNAFLHEPGHFDPPAFCLSFNFVFIPDADMFRRLCLAAIVFNLAGIAGSRCQCPCLIDEDRPDVFIQPYLFFFSD